MTNIKYIVWDLETTGFVAPESKILEIGCHICYEDGSTEDKNWLLNNNVEIPEKITEITSIDNKLIELEGRDPKECINEFMPIIKEAENNITHNGIKFDIPFLVEYTADLLDMKNHEKEDLYDLLYEKAYDTAVFFKAKELDEDYLWGETYLDFAKRVMNIRSSVKYNLGLVADTYGIDRSKIKQHRAMGDVWLTKEIFIKINNK